MARFLVAEQRELKINKMLDYIATLTTDIESLRSIAALRTSEAKEAKSAADALQEVSARELLRNNPRVWHETVSRSRILWSCIA